MEHYESDLNIAPLAVLAATPSLHAACDAGGTGERGASALFHTQLGSRLRHLGGLLVDLVLLGSSRR